MLLYILLYFLPIVVSLEVSLEELPVFHSETELLSNITDLQAKLVLVLLYGSGGSECKQLIEKMEVPKILDELVRFSAEELSIPGLAAASLTEKDFEKRHHIKGCPNLLLYREGVPVVYDGENLHMGFNRDDIGQWISSNMQSNVRHLADDTFEHLTQAVTGSTTGDWIIWFHETKCSELTAVWEAVASRLRYSKVVGEVDITLNPKVAQRFSIKSCQEIIFIRQGKYYTYTGDTLGVHALANFAEISYKNFKSQAVPAQPSPFDETIEEISQWLKESEYGLLVILGVTLLLLASILFLICHESKGVKPQQKKD